MGLAASQARLLTITARLADNELRSQTINNAKMRLATQSSQASENYINALNDATLKFANYDTTGAAQTQTLNYNALTAYSSYNTQYGLVNSSGQLLVSEEEAALYEKSNEDLDTYLQYHGLTYDTTYFDEIGNITSTGYPDEFEVLTVSDMKEIYKNYSSIENSQEVETYNDAYNEYRNTRGSLLQSACQKVFQNYMTSSTDITNQLTYNAGSFSTTPISGRNLQAKFQSLKNMLSDSKNNFALNDPVISALLANSPSTRQEINDILNSVQISGNSITFEDEEIVYPSVASDGSKTYVIDGITITVDSTGSNITATPPEAEDGETVEFTPGSNTSSITAFINGMSVKYTDNDGIVVSETFSGATLNSDDNDSITVKLKNTNPNVGDGTSQEEVINDILDSVVWEILDDLSVNFAELLYGTDSTDKETYQSIVTAAGVDLSENVNGNKTLEEVFADAEAAENDYLKTVFSDEAGETGTSSVEYVKALIDNETTPITYTDENGVEQTLTDEDGNPRAITYEDLTDVDFLLRFMNANSENVQMSETFKTVVKEFMMDNIIAEYGTPKYAWQDSTDINNTGNADAKAQWYTNLFNRMQQGYKALENGLASSNEWIEYALESGIVTMEQVDSSYEWQGLDYKACAKITEETDDAAVTKAEAEYNRAMNDIESKDNIYDIELKNIDTEHSSLQTEYDSIKTVISKNVERTFNFYKNA